MKVLGSRVTFVRRNSPTKVTVRYIYSVVMKVWSRMFAETVRSVSVQQLNWDLMHWNTQTSNIFAVVHVVNISSIKILSNVTSIYVLLNWDMSMSYSGSKCCRLSGQLHKNWLVQSTVLSVCVGNICYSVDVCNLRSYLIDLTIKSSNWILF